MMRLYILSIILGLGACSSKEAPKSGAGVAPAKDCNEKKVLPSGGSTDPFAFKVNDDCPEDKPTTPPAGTSPEDLKAVQELRDRSAWSDLAKQQFKKHEEHRIACKGQNRAHLAKNVHQPSACSLVEDLAMDDATGTACGKLGGTVEELSTSIAGLFKEKMKLNEASTQRYKERVQRYYNEGYIRFSCATFPTTGRPIITFMRELKEDPGSLHIEYLVSSQDKDSVE
jgi:hypothetical protein